MRQTIHVVALSRLHIRQLARLRLCVVQVDMQHGVIVFVLRAPEVLHAQTLGGNMLSRDNIPRIHIVRNFHCLAHAHPERSQWCSLYNQVMFPAAFIVSRMSVPLFDTPYVPLHHSQTNRSIVFMSLTKYLFQVLVQPSRRTKRCHGLHHHIIITLPTQNMLTCLLPLHLMN